MPMDPCEQYDALMEECDRLCRPVDAGLLSGDLRADALVALACAALDVDPAPAIREVVELREIGTQRLTELARAVLDEVGFEPGFDGPGRLERLEHALRVVARDLPREIDTTALRLRTEARGNPEPCAVVEFAPGWSYGSGVPASAGDDPQSALLAMADHVQEGVMERIRAVWPVCGTHARGVDPASHEGRVVWHCPAGHILGPVGELHRRRLIRGHGTRRRR